MASHVPGLSQTSVRLSPVVFHNSADKFRPARDISRLVIDPAALQMMLGALTGWLDRREREAVAYLIEENRLLRRQVGSGDCVSPTMIADGSPRGRTGWAARPCARSPPSPRPTRCCAGIGSSLPGSGRTLVHAAGAASSWRSSVSWCGWRRKIPRGATRGSKAR